MFIATWPDAKGNPKQVRSGISVGYYQLAGLLVTRIGQVTDKEVYIRSLIVKHAFTVSFLK